jgi:glutaredoxin 3
LHAANRCSAKAAFTEHDVATDPSFANKWIAPAPTFRKFTSARPVGGCDELYALDRAGKLDSLLAGEKATS